MLTSSSSIFGFAQHAALALLAGAGAADALTSFAAAAGFAQVAQRGRTGEEPQPWAKTMLSETISSRPHLGQRRQLAEPQCPDVDLLWSSSIVTPWSAAAGWAAPTTAA